MDHDTDQDADYGQVLNREFRRTYEEGKDTWTAEPAMQHLVPLLAEWVAPRGRVLDVGAGRGRDTEALLERGYRVVAVDLVELPEWRVLGERWSGQVEYVVGDVLEVNVGRGFHAIIDNGALHHQLPEDYGRYLKTLRDVLVPAGHLAISLFVRPESDEAGVLHEGGGGRLSREFTTAEAQELLSAAGFTVVASRRVPRRRPDRAYLLLIAQAPGS